MGIKQHIAVHLLVGYSHRKFVAEEKLEVGLRRPKYVI
jgi:hypothetical protein